MKKQVTIAPKAEQTTKQTAFERLLREYEHQAVLRKLTLEQKQDIMDNNFYGMSKDERVALRKEWRAVEDTYTTALTNLAKSIAHSVLKKVIDPTAKTDLKKAKDGTLESKKIPYGTAKSNSMLVKIKNSIERDYNALARAEYAVENATEHKENANGDIVTNILDSDLNKDTHKLLEHICGEGIDLVHDAVVAIMSETIKVFDRCFDDIVNDFECRWMEQIYTVRELKKKVKIKEEDSVNGWQTVETTPVQEAYKSVRRCVETSRAKLNDPRNGYIYLEELATDPESDAVDIIYKRFGKYADLGGYAVDSNGRETLYSGEEYTAEELERISEKLNLSAVQTKILKYRLRGCGYGSIATRLGVSEGSVYNHIKAIRKKALAIGLNPIK